MTSMLETSSLRDLGVNSLDLVVLVMAIEEHFHIEFEPERPGAAANVRRSGAPRGRADGAPLGRRRDGATSW